MQARALQARAMQAFYNDQARAPPLRPHLLDVPR